MVVKLDARIPLVWRDPFSLQFGVDPARVVLREVSTADERVIHALATGVGASGLAMVARTAGATDADLDRLLERLQPLLLPAPVRSASKSTSKPVSKPVVCIAGTGLTVELIAEALVAANLAVTVSATPSDPSGDFGIAVGHYVLDPGAHGHWLRRDIPHLAVTFGDAVATVGPLVEPGRTACLYCVEFHRRDADSSWSAIASQLWGRRSAAETPLVAREVAAMVARMVSRRLVDPGDGAPGAAGATSTVTSAVTSTATSTATSLRIDAYTGSVSSREWLPHPACGCAQIDGDSAAMPGEARRESDSAADSVLPTRVVAAAERA